MSRPLKTLVHDDHVRDMADIPDNLLGPLQQRVKRQTLSGETWFDAAGAAAVLAPRDGRISFLDFETIQFAIPVWAGTRPYQQIPFQFSLHMLEADGRLSHTGFLDLAGDEPSRRLAEALVPACAGDGVVWAYNAAFERTVIRALAEQFIDLAPALEAIVDRIEDLLPVARDHYYNPSQKGSWSIKAVLPAVAPDLSYADIGEVHDGSGAQDAYMEAIRTDTPAERRETIRIALDRYCELDTLAMVRLWRFLRGVSAGAAGTTT